MLLLSLRSPGTFSMTMTSSSSSSFEEIDGLGLLDGEELWNNDVVEVLRLSFLLCGVSVA